MTVRIRMDKSVSLPIGLVVAVYFITTATGYLNNESSVYCVTYKDFPSWISIHQDSFDTLESRVRNCRVMKRYEDGEEEFSTPISLVNDIFYGISKDNENLLYILITCLTKTRIYFTDYSNNINFTVKIGYLVTENCEIYWNDIDKLGRVIDLRFIILNNRVATFQRELEKGYFTNSTLMSALPMGLRNIGAIQLTNTEQTPTEPILTDYEWPRMGLLRLVNYNLPSDIYVFRFSMPTLQHIILRNCSITTPLQHFPWSDEFLDLPRNTARLVSSYMNHDFSLSLPRNVYERIVDYQNNDISDLSNTSFTGRFHALFLGSNKIDRLTAHTFSQLKMVQLINASYNRLASLPKEVFYNLTNLKYLYMDGNRLHQMNPEMFLNNPGMLLLSLANNVIESVHQDAFQELDKLHTLDLSQNKLRILPNTSSIKEHLSNLRVMNLTSNKISIIPQLMFSLAKAHTIDISNNPITWQSFVQSLDYIDQSAFISQNILLDGSCYKPDKQTKHLQLRRLHELHTLRIDELSAAELEMLKYLLKCLQLDFDESSLNCDCNVYGSYLFIHSHLIDYPYMNANFKCYKPGEFHTRPLVSLERSDLRCAQNLTDCPTQCTCYFQPSENQITVDCSNLNLTSLPSKVPEHTAALIASGNLIEELKYENLEYFTKLHSLDLSDNVISIMDSSFPSFVSSLYILKIHNNRLGILPKEVSAFYNTTLTLRGNPWKCDCNTEWMKEWIFARRNHLDIDDMICATGDGRGTAMVDVPSEQFVCQIIPNSHALKTSLITVSVVAAFVVVAITLMYKYRGEIKVLLYVHFNWHPFDRAPEADVLDKDYDVFISYSSDDFYIAKEVMDFLESLDPPFKVCLHDRDFMVGAPIQENIMDSVRTSRRMIMILTKNYLNSNWCLYEFRAGHARVIQDHTNYLILVLADIIPEEKYDDDMKLYIRTTTYLELANTWFYDKLKYVLPEKTLCELQTKRKTLDDSNVYYVNDAEQLEI